LERDAAAKAAKAAAPSAHAATPPAPKEPTAGSSDAPKNAAPRIIPVEGKEKEKE
jgi:hypothetical protein